MVKESRIENRESNEDLAMSFNKITIVGYLGRDPELRVRHAA